MRRALILIAALWAISLPAYLLHKLANPDRVYGCVLYAHLTFWIGQDEDFNTKVILPSDAAIQEDLEQLILESDYSLTFQYSPRASTRIFRRWNSVASSSFIRIHATDGGPVDRDGILSLILTEAEAALAQPDPPYEYTELRDHGMLEAIRTNTPVITRWYSANIAIDLLTLVWGVGSIMLSCVFLGLILSKLVSNNAKLCCQFCNYAIEGLPSAICPECGQQHTQDETA